GTDTLSVASSNSQSMPAGPRMFQVAAMHGANPAGTLAQQVSPWCPLIADDNAHFLGRLATRVRRQRETRRRRCPSAYSACLIAWRACSAFSCLEFSCPPVGRRRVQALLPPCPRGLRS